ncbi:MAG TPA: hypothetical protein VM925_37490 [Labilithrix sp.]|nr:hypothetical protein [Labilithrix sp.]
MKLSSNAIGLVVLVAALVPVTLASTSCTEEATTSPDRADAGGEGGPLAADVTAFITELCALYAPCCGSTASDTCRTTTDALARSATFDATRASACLDSIRAEAKGTSFCITAPSSVACSAVFKAPSTKAPGEACKQSSDCSSGDDGDGICVLQTCRRAKAGKEGDDCFATRVEGKTEIVFGSKAVAGAICSSAAGLYCSETSKKCQKRGGPSASCSGPDVSCVDEAWCPTTTNECVPRTLAGASCEDEYECALGLRCANDGQGGAACTALEAKGGPCERGDECDTRKGLVCDAVTTTCIEDTSRADLACKGSLSLVQ